MNEWRIIHVGDQHMDTVAPSSRKDDYYEAIQAKFNEIKEISHAEPTAAVIYSGDMINKQDGSRVPYWLTNWLIDHFAHFDEGYQVPSDEETELVATMGNHDVKAAKSEFWERQPIGSIIKAGRLQPLWCNPLSPNPTGYVIHQLRNAPIRIHGRLYSYQADQEGFRPLYYSIVKDPTMFEIASLHTQLMPNGQTQMFDYTNPSHIDAQVPPEQRPDLYVCGHVHDNLGVFNGSGYQCVNYGALSRGSIDEYNLHRPVQVAEIRVTEVTKGHYRCAIRPIILKCAKPSSEVFYVKELEKKRIKQAEMVFLADTLKADNLREVFRLVNPDEAIAMVLRNQQVAPEVAELVKKYVDQAKQELGL